MEITTKYNIGDKFYNVAKIKTTYSEHKCDICDNTGYVSLKNVLFECPKCFGKGIIYKEKEMFTIREYTIAGIDLNINDEGEVETFYNAIIKGGFNKRPFLYNERSKSDFLTKEEAEEKLKIINNKKAEIINNEC